MGRYFNPVGKLPDVGRSLTFKREYQDLCAQLSPDEVLVGLYDKVIYKVAPILIDNERDFTGFEQDYRLGYYISRSFYAVTKAVVAEYNRGLEL